MRRPFTLYKEKGKSGTVWYARFWDESVQKYAHSRSTQVQVEGKKERRYEAEEAAKQPFNKFTAAKSNFAASPASFVSASVQIDTFAKTLLFQCLEGFCTQNSQKPGFRQELKKTRLFCIHLAFREILQYKRL